MVTGPARRPKQACAVGTTKSVAAQAHGPAGGALQTGARDQHHGAVHEQSGQLAQRSEHALTRSHVDDRLGTLLEDRAHEIWKNSEWQRARRVGGGKQPSALDDDVAEGERMRMLDLADVLRVGIQEQHRECRVALMLVKCRGKYSCPGEIAPAHDRAHIHERHSMDMPALQSASRPAKSPGSFLPRCQGSETTSASPD